MNETPKPPNESEGLNPPDKPPPIPRAELCQVTTEDSSTMQGVSIEPDGTLKVSGYDTGPFVGEFTGRDDYEFWYEVAPATKDTLLLALIVDRFGGSPDATKNFREYLEARDIPYKLDIW